MTPKPTTDQVIPVTVAAPLEGGLNQPSSVIPERPTAMWRIVEVPMYPRGVYGIETNNREAVENNEAIILYPCLTRANAELIVQAHNSELTSALAASAPSCPVGEKELENCADLSGTNQQEPRSSTSQDDDK